MNAAEGQKRDEHGIEGSSLVRSLDGDFLFDGLGDEFVMAKTEIFTCDVCGRQKGEVNHWYMLSIMGGEFILSAWDADKKHAHKHLCGQECVIKAVNEYLSSGGK